MKTIFKSALLFIALTISFVLFMLLAAYVPQDAVRENMTKSAEYLCEDIVFPYAIEGVGATMIDRYADSITSNIAWHLGEGDRLKSVMLGAYYYSKLQNENFNFLHAMTGEPLEGGEVIQYMRYWHGSAAVVRLLHLIMTLKGIYILHAVLVGALVLLNIICFAVRKMYDCIIAFILGLVFTSSWFVPLSLEYTWVYLIFLAEMLIVFFLHDKGKENLYISLLLAGGMITCYLDFLSAETLTLTMPLILMIRLDHKNGKASFIAKNCLAWGIGYAGCWVSKWIIAAAVLRENVMPYIAEHIAERAGGQTLGIPEMSTPVFIYNALLRNVINLFPAGYGTGGLFVGVAIVIVFAYIAYVYRRKGIEKKTVLSYLFIAMIPYVRFVLLHNHAYIHYFFAGRAQCAAIMAMVLLVLYVTDLPGAAGARKRKKR